MGREGRARREQEEPGPSLALGEAASSTMHQCPDQHPLLPSGLSFHPGFYSRLTWVGAGWTLQGVGMRLTVYTLCL